MKVHVLIDSLGLGGAESLLVPFACAARRAGDEVHVAALERRADGDDRMVGVLREIGIEPVVLGIDRLVQPDGIIRAARAIRAVAADVVHAHLGYSITLGVPAARLVGVPVVGTFHHIPQDLPRAEALKERLSIIAAARSDRCIFVSAAQRNEFVRRYRSIGRRSCVVTNGIEIPSEAGVPPSEGAPVVTIVAALRRPKGHRFALNAWPEVLGVAPGAVLRVVGSGPEESALRRQADELGIGASLEFTGFRRDLTTLIGSSTIVLSASETEALPTSLMEAASLGVPSIATDVGGTREVVEEGVTGLLIPPGDEHAIAKAVTTLLSDHRRRAVMADGARRWATDHFDADLWWSRLTDVYAAALAARRRRST